ISTGDQVPAAPDGEATSPAGADGEPLEPLVLGELKVRMSELENANEAVDDLVAVKLGEARIEDFTGRRAQDLRVLMEIDNRAGGIEHFIESQIALQNDLQAEAAGMSAALKK